MKITKTKAIPEFTTLEEERQYWEARGLLAEGKRGRVNRTKAANQENTRRGL
ncbi:MAG: hypothetical protein HW384_72 [Dehalococcoidia bacterium]|nr:hypothetical protein [Dehalococcoidia bacterium]